MNKMILIIVSLFATLELAAQENTTSKYWTAVGTTGALVTEVAYDFDQLTMGRETLQTRILVVSHGSNILKFLHLGGREPRIEKGDLNKLVDAIAKLKGFASSDQTNSAKEVKRFFKTVDGFEVGFTKDSSIKWYYTSSEMMSSKTINIESFESLLQKAKAKMAGL